MNDPLLKVPTWLNRALLVLLLLFVAAVGYVANTYGWECVEGGGALFQDNTDVCQRPGPVILDAG